MNAQHLYTTPFLYDQRLKVMFGTTLGGLVGFAVLSFVLVRYKLFIVQEVVRPIFSVLSFFVPTLAVIGIVLSLWVFAHIVSSATRYPKLLDKLDIYETACILRWTIVCVPMAFSLIGFSLTGRRLFLYLFGVLILFLGAAYPSRKKASAYLRLSYDHHDIILNDEFPLQNADHFEDEPEETSDTSPFIAQPIPH